MKCWTTSEATAEKEIIFKLHHSSYRWTSCQFPTHPHMDFRVCKRLHKLVRQDLCLYAYKHKIMRMQSKWKMWMRERERERWKPRSAQKWITLFVLSGANRPCCFCTQKHKKTHKSMHKSIVLFPLRRAINTELWMVFFYVIGLGFRLRNVYGMKQARQVFIFH